MPVNLVCSISIQIIWPVIKIVSSKLCGVVTYSTRLSLTGESSKMVHFSAWLNLFD